MTYLINALVLIVTVVAMEGAVALTHRYVMHGWGWGWHRSHHEVHDDLLEKNDLYAIVFGGFTFGLIVLGWQQGFSPIYFVGIGKTLYGFLYFFVHDGLVHQRWPFRVVPKHPYMKRLVQAHRLHHATHGRDGAVSFGFLWAKPVRELKAELKARHGRVDLDETRDLREQRASAP